MEVHSFGNWLKRQRKAHDLTQVSLADQVGCSAATIRKIEAEERRPSTQIVARLADIFAIPPGERSHFHKFARGSWGAGPAHSPKETLPWRGEDQPRRVNLPAAVTSLVDREREIAQLRADLSHPQARLVTLTGAAGIGKTRLSLEVVRQLQPVFLDGVYFVSLSMLDEPGLVARAVLQALGYVEAKGMPAIQVMIDGIGIKRMLLVLDNCEHLVEGVASLAVELLVACPGLKILATSREALRIPGERLFPVPTLPVPRHAGLVDLQQADNFPALTLFTERARLVQPDFQLSEGNLRAVASLCIQLDGLPLAIELFAARMRLMSPQTLLDRLTDQLVLSADGRRGVPMRQKTLGDAIGWSYRSLPADEQELFAGLGVFAGGFNLDTAEAIFGDGSGKPVADLIMALSDKSLLQRSIDIQGEVRFSMLGTIRAFALDCLRKEGKQAQVYDRHLAYSLDFAEKADLEMRGPDQAAWIERVEVEQDNLRAALSWCVESKNTEAGLRLLGALGWPWEVRSHSLEMTAWFEKIRLLDGVAQHPQAYARLLSHVGRHLWTQMNPQDAREILEQSLEIWSGLGEAGEPGVADVLSWQALVVLHVDRQPGQAETLLLKSRQLFHKWSDPRESLSIFHLGILESERQEEPAAREFFEQSLASFQSHGDLFFIGRVASCLGFSYLKTGEFESARQSLRLQEESERALQHWDGIASALNNLGDLYRRQGMFEQAEKVYLESLEVCCDHGLRTGHSWYHLGWLALHRDDFSLAEQRYREYIAPARQRYSQDSAGFMLMGLAAVAGGNGQAERAARLWGASQKYLGPPRDAMEAYDWTEFERHVGKACEQLGEPRFAALVEQGAEMEMEPAVVYALAVRSAI